MNNPNFFVLGAAKCATTSLYMYLDNHPQIYMSPVKEPNFFACENQQLDYQGLGYEKNIKSQTITDYSSYLSLFQSVRQEKAIGEASWSSLYYPQASKRIKHYFPDAKFIVILRNPIERAFSHHQYLLQHHRENIKSFSQAIALENERIQQKYWADWHYIKLGFYSNQLKKYFSIFEREQFKIIYFERFKSNRIATLKEIFDFLNVDNIAIEDSKLVQKKHNQTMLPRISFVNSFIERANYNGRLQYILKKTIPKQWHNTLKKQGDRIYNLNLYKPVLSKAMRQHLKEIYLNEIQALENLLGSSLEHWKQ